MSGFLTSLTLSFVRYLAMRFFFIGSKFFTDLLNYTLFTFAITKTNRYLKTLKSKLEKIIYINSF